jgi:hypothetical protein
MKMKGLFFCALFLIVSMARAQYVSIPDTAFGSWISQNGFSNCMTGNDTIGWQLDTTCPALLADTFMDFYYTASNLEGVQYFKNLKYLICTINTIDSIRELPPSLVHFNCSFNLLNRLPTLPLSLSFLDCQHNNLYNLPDLPAALDTLICVQNNLSTLPVLPNRLALLDCYGNQLNMLPILPLNLTYLYCSTNILTSLPSLPPSLTSLYCEQNRLTSLPTLPASLVYLECAFNNLKTLPDLPDSMAEFGCSANDSLSCMPHLGIIVNLYFNNTAITCLPNYPTGNAGSTPDLSTVSLCSGPCYPLGVKNINESTQVSIFPNPASDNISFEYASDGSTTTIMITNLLGQTMYESEMTTNTQSIDVHSWSAGLYYLRWQTAGSTMQVSTIVKE